MKCLSERTKSSWSLQTLARFIFIAIEIYSGNKGLVWDIQENLENIFISHSLDKFNYFIHFKIQSLILYPYIGVPQTVHFYKSFDYPA